jgi:hypothetical protein
MRKLKRSKLGELIDQKELTYKEFAELVFAETGFFIHKENVCNYATGLREIKTLKLAINFAKALNVDVNDII